MKKWFLLSMFFIFSYAAYCVPPPAAEVFKVETNRIDPNAFVIKWQIKPGYFLYADRIKLSEQDNSNVQLTIIRLPETEKKTDRQGNNYAVYRNELSLPVAVLSDQPGETSAIIHYQGCSDDGFCYPPETRQIKLTIDKANELSAVELESASNKPKSIEQKNTTKEEAVFSQHIVIVILTFFGFGLLLAFTPCVLPMIPVLSGIIVGHGKNITTRKAFFLSLSYVLSMAVTYAAVGALIAHLGSNLQIIMQSAWAISLFSLIFILLSFSMFGFYELRMPTSWQAKLASVSHNQMSGHYLSAAIMGSLSTLILSPCVTAPLIGALGYIANTGNLILGSLALFFLGIGMGTPLLLIGTSAGKLLPTAGIWMNTVKLFFGFLLLGMAIYLLQRILPSLMTMILWGGLLVFTGIFMGALNLSKQNRFAQSIGIILLIYGLLILTGASLGSDNPLLPLKSLNQNKFTAHPLTSQKTVTSLKEVQTAIKEAEGKAVMVDFYADWCTACKVMEATTFKNPAVREALKDFVILKADITAYSKENKTLLAYYNVIAPPTFLFFDKEGNELKSLRITGDAEAAAFLQNIKDYYQVTSES